MATTVVLVRHGESLWNAENRLQGQGGSGLSPLGEAQAQATAEYLRHRYPDASRAERSDLERVEQTAAPWLAVSEVPVRVDIRWREIDVGTWSGLTWPEVAEKDPDTLAAWRAGTDVRRGGGETFAELRIRTSAALQDLAREAGTVVIFTHGGSIRLGVAAAIGLPVMGEHALGPIANCGITELALDERGTRLLSYNVHDHLSAVTAPATQRRREIIS